MKEEEGFRKFRRRSKSKEEAKNFKEEVFYDWTGNAGPVTGLEIMVFMFIFRNYVTYFKFKKIVKGLDYKPIIFFLIFFATFIDLI